MEKLFLFNPFNIKEWSNEEVKSQMDILLNNITGNDTPREISDDIEIYANVCCLIGEMVARYYEDTSIADAQLKVAIANSIYRKRKNWSGTNTEKAPAMSYFENEALSEYLEDTIALAKMESNLKRFKYAYDSFDNKMNALKKKLESLKYDMGIR